MISIEKTGKTVNDAVAAALDELQATKEQVEIEVLEESKNSLFGIFGGRLAKVKVTKKDVIETVIANDKNANYVTETEEETALDMIKVVENREDAELAAKEFLQKLFAAMKINVVMEKFFNKEENSTVFKLHGPGMGVLIGKHGQTLDSLQYLTNLVANKHSQERVRFIVDVEDYRERRKETLVRLAQRLADKVKRTGEKVVLEPMNPYERKLIHMTLQNDEKVTTYSEGEEPYRKAVIDLK
ncbi:MAG: protein jag [Acidaminococcaceae bacterium]|nr:protein jag [Acidaminococcaceae bacterium]